jgi:pimeloyl-ACP methyl ester carboxylesterase
MVLVGASLGGAAAIDFTLSHPEAVSSHPCSCQILSWMVNLYAFKSRWLNLNSSGSQVAKLVLVNAQGYAEGTGKMATFPRFLAYAGVTFLTRAVFLCVGLLAVYLVVVVFYASSYVVYTL